MILHADIDAFFAAVEILLQPSLKGRPVVVGGLPNERGVVATASYEARPYGIRSGMPLALAYRLCPHAVFLRGNFANYHEYSDKFFKILERFGPVVEAISLDEAYVDIGGTERLFGPPEVLGDRIRREVREKTGLAITVGIARQRTIAKISTDLAKPDGLRIIPEGEELPVLEPLPVSIIPGVGAKTGERLRLVGIRTVGDLVGAPEWMIKEAVGKIGVSIRKLLLGGRFRCGPITHSISRETTLAEDSNDREFLEALLCYLTDRAATAARRQKVMAKTITVKVRFSDFRTISRSKGIELTSVSQQIFPVVREIFLSMIKGVRKRVRLVGVALGKLQAETGQPSLFEEERLKRLDLGVDRVRDRFGFSSLFWAKERLVGLNYKKRRDGYQLHTPSLSQ